MAAAKYDDPFDRGFDTPWRTGEYRDDRGFDVMPSHAKRMAISTSITRAATANPATNGVFRGPNWRADAPPTLPGILTGPMGGVDFTSRMFNMFPGTTTNNQKELTGKHRDNVLQPIPLPLRPSGDKLRDALSQMKYHLCIAERNESAHGGAIQQSDTGTQTSFIRSYTPQLFVAYLNSAEGKAKYGSSVARVMEGFKLMGPVLPPEGRDKDVLRDAALKTQIAVTSAVGSVEVVNHSPETLESWQEGKFSHLRLMYGPDPISVAKYVSKAGLGKADPAGTARLNPCWFWAPVMWEDEFLPRGMLATRFEVPDPCVELLRRDAAAHGSLLTQQAGVVPMSLAYTGIDFRLGWVDKSVMPTGDPPTREEFHDAINPVPGTWNLSDMFEKSQNLPRHRLIARMAMNFAPWADKSLFYSEKHVSLMTVREKRHANGTVEKLTSPASLLSDADAELEIAISVLARIADKTAPQSQNGGRFQSNVAAKAAAAANAAAGAAVVPPPPPVGVAVPAPAAAAVAAVPAPASASASVPMGAVGGGAGVRTTHSHPAAVINNAPRASSSSSHRGAPPKAPAMPSQARSHRPRPTAAAAAAAASGDGGGGLPTAVADAVRSETDD